MWVIKWNDFILAELVLYSIIYQCYLQALINQMDIWPCFERDQDIKTLKKHLCGNDSLEIWDFCTNAFIWRGQISSPQTWGSFSKFCQSNQSDYHRFNQAHDIEILTEATHQTSGQTALAVHAFRQKKEKKRRQKLPI